MENHPYNNIGPAASNSFKTVEEAVSALTPDQLERLAHIAARRLDRLASGSPGKRLRGIFDSREFVSDAIVSLLQGAAPDQPGRRTHPRHLVDQKAFLNFLQAVIQSLVSSAFKSIRRQGEHVNWDDLPTPMAATSDVVAEVAQRETSGYVFLRLKKQAVGNPGLLDAIRSWEVVALETDKPPKGTLSDQALHRVRLHARQVLQALARQEGISGATGKEMLLP